MIKNRYKSFVVISLVLGVLIILTPGCSLFKTRSRPLPDSPFDLTAIAVYSDEINLAWKYLADQHDGFYLYRKTTGDSRKIAVLEASTSSYVDSPLDPETTYSYYMSTYNRAGESDPSEIVSATTPPEVELLGYEFSGYWCEYCQEWHTNVNANLKNQTRRVLTIRVKVNFFSSEDVLVVTKGSFASNVEPLKTQLVYFYYTGEEIGRVEVWIDDYY